MVTTTTIGSAALVIAAVLSLAVATMTERRLRRKQEEAEQMMRNAEMYYRLLVQAGDMLLRKESMKDCKGRPMRMHSHVSFVSGAMRREGYVVFNINDEGEISKTVPICIRTEENEKFMPALVEEIRPLRKRKD